MSETIQCSSSYCEGGRVQVYCKKRMNYYRAKVLKIRINDGAKEYLVHFMNWHKRFDTWIPWIDIRPDPIKQFYKITGRKPACPLCSLYYPVLNDHLELVHKCKMCQEYFIDLIGHIYHMHEAKYTAFVKFWMEMAESTPILPKMCPVCRTYYTNVKKHFRTTHGLIIENGRFYFREFRVPTDFLKWNETFLAQCKMDKNEIAPCIKDQSIKPSLCKCV